VPDIETCLFLQQQLYVFDTLRKAKDMLQADFGLPSDRLL